MSAAWWQRCASCARAARASDCQLLGCLPPPTCQPRQRFSPAAREGGADGGPAKLVLQDFGQSAVAALHIDALHHLPPGRLPYCQGAIIQSLLSCSALQCAARLATAGVGHSGLALSCLIAVIVPDFDLHLLKIRSLAGTRGHRFGSGLCGPAAMLAAWASRGPWSLSRLAPSATARMQGLLRGLATTADEELGTTDRR